MENLDLKKKLYQMFILAPTGFRYEESPNLDIALKQGLGGIIFFTHNIKTAKQFKNLIETIKENAILPPFLSIDQEGGRVERTENIHNGKKYLSAKIAFAKGLDFLESQTQEIASELKSYGINMNFSPVLDVNTCDSNPIIGERAFSSKTDEVITASNIVIKTYLKNKIIPVAKHFPGHGMTSLDSHLTMPVCDLSFEELERIHIAPFKNAIAQNIPAIMVSHIHYKCFDKEAIPASISNNVIKKRLRQTLNFKGLIVSDDMDMGGISGFSRLEAITKAIHAGINLFLFRNCEQEIMDTIEQVYQLALNDHSLKQNIEQSFERIYELKCNHFKLAIRQSS